MLENSSREDKHECPFGRSAIELTKMLCEILQVGELRKSAAASLQLEVTTARCQEGPEGLRRGTLFLLPPPSVMIVAAVL